MRLLFIMLALSLLLSTAKAQGWTTPVNVSDMGLPAGTPDITVDHTGMLHVVWSRAEDLHSVVLYATSADKGDNWSTPDTIVEYFNSRIMDPHIVCDQLNHLYVSFSINIQSPALQMACITNNAGSGWSLPDTLSGYGALSNFLVIDNTDRIYCFWNAWIDNMDKIGYRYYENGVWSEEIVPYNNIANHASYMLSVCIDGDNNIHAEGKFYELNEPSFGTNHLNKVNYFYYNRTADLWALPVLVSDTLNFNPERSISTDTLNQPHICWNLLFKPNYEYNATLTTFQDNGFWTLCDTIEQNHNSDYNNILVDYQNNTHVMLNRCTKIGWHDYTELACYRNIQGIWEYSLLDTVTGGITQMKMVMVDSATVGVIYSKGISNPLLVDIFFSKYNIYTGLDSKLLLVPEIKASPNPFIGDTKIQYTLNSPCRVCIDLFDMQGKHIIRLLDQRQPAGSHTVPWQGTDFNGKELQAGMYVARLKAGNCTGFCKVVKQ